MSKRPVTKIRGKGPSGSGGKRVKSYKADGTPKKRWTTAERAERGHGPRRSGGRPRNDRDNDRRDDRRFSNDRDGERRFSNDRDGERRFSNDRDARGDRRDDRGGRWDNRRDAAGGDRRDDRPAYRDRREDRRDDRWERRDDRRDHRRAEHRPHPNRSWENRERRREDRRDYRDRDRGFDNDAGRQRAEVADEAADTMSWTATELADVDASTVADDAGFAELGVPKILVGALDQQGITTPFPIQAATIPDALAGKDVLGRGRTGSGKTLGFGLPLLARLAGGEAAVSGAPGGVVLVPTRELAMQVADVLAPLAKTVGLSTTLVAGGMAFGPQIKAFDRGVDVVVATPGRLIDLMEQGIADLSQVQIAVLDEADHMADLGFLEAVTTLLDAMPTGGQRMLFSATLDRGVDRLVKRYLTDPVTHEVDSAKASITTMHHHVLHVLPHDKNAATAAIANREGRTVVFVRTQRGADRVADQLRQAGVMAGALHGGLTQGARARILKAFKDGTVPVLVATDVAARGIHVDEVSLVLQVDPPMGPKDYLHRAGRTARAGTEGHVVSLILPHQRKAMRRLTGMAGVKVAPVEVRPHDELLAELTGARRPEGDPVTEEDYQARIAPPRPVRKSRPQRKRGWGRDDADRGGRRGGKFQHRRPRD